MSSDNQLEEKTLKLNFIIAVIYAVFSIVIVYFAQSLTVLLDTGYSIVTVLIYAFSIYVIKKINQPANDRYPYGYYRLEPVFILFESGFVLLIAISVILISIINMITHAIKPNYGFALLSEIVGTVLCIVMFIFVYKKSKVTGSRILAADAELWKADSLLGIGVTLAIFIGFILEYLGYHKLAIYVDPIIAICMGIFIMKNPIKLIMESYSHLLDVAPVEELEIKIFHFAEEIAKKYSIAINQVKATQSGRFIFVDIHLNPDQVLEGKKLSQYKTELKKIYNKKFSCNEFKVYILL
ncbi:cation diffusion facilitator family transporter [Pseudofrancisella aestuarii]|uniref:Cation diffusion facilitator family transporter n=1 Tax=Pseudofrancisella aestuarii TaxID=2670347 RepID=A0ABV9T9F6_9GAMM|nr:cation diffusion facilitator family transporter [Pseudofrancisella aestuarii]